MTEPIASLADHRLLARALATRIGADRSIETHISTVLLANGYAYKLKKPLALGFLDFTTIAARRHFCNEELRINHRTAPMLYLDVRPITGSLAAPVLGGEGPVLDYALRMRRFPAGGELDRIAARGELDHDLAGALGRMLAALHAQAAVEGPDRPRAAGAPHVVLDWARANFATMLAAPHLPAQARAPLATLADWTEDTFARRSHQFAARHSGGFVRECHGDLHLANIVRLDGVPVAFDALEFDPLARWIDCMSDAAFLYMDLLDHNLSSAAWTFLNRYIEDSGDHRGLATLEFYAVYRAMVRAKVYLIRAGEPDIDRSERRAALMAFERYLALGERLAAGRTPRLIAMHGLAGSGKSTVAAALAESIGALRIRSDVERKRLHGRAPNARGGAAAGLYGASANQITYARLAELAAIALDARQAVIIDATTLKRADRDRLRAVADRAGAPFALIECTAAPEVLRERVTARASAGADPSEADAAVLAAQQHVYEPIAADERAQTWTIATDQPSAARLAAQLTEIRRALTR